MLCAVEPVAQLRSTETFKVTERPSKTSEKLATHFHHLREEKQSKATPC